LSLAKQPAIKEGLFYDIMWQNTNMQYLNADKIYAFVRYSKQQQLLIVCNFDVGEQVIYLRMPSPALEKLGIPRPIKVCFTDLQTKQTSCIGSEELIHNGLKLEIKPMWYTVLEIKV